VPAARRTQWIALFGVSGMLPISLGGAIGDWLLRDHDYRALFLVAWGLAVASLLCSLPLRDAQRPAVTGTRPVGIRAALRQRDLVPLWFLGTVFSVALTAFFVFIKTFVEAHPIGTVGGFFTAYTAAALVLRAFFGWLPDRAGPKRVLAPALAALAAGFAVLAGADGPADVLAAGVLYGFGTLPFDPPGPRGRARRGGRGAALAVFTASSTWDTDSGPPSAS
jgi:MFS family permease